MSDNPRDALCPPGWVQVEGRITFICPLGYDTERIADVLGDWLGPILYADDGRPEVIVISNGCEAACGQCGCTPSRRCDPSCDPVGRAPDLCNRCA